MKHQKAEQYTSCSAEETQRLGCEYAQTLQPGAIVALFGDLGAGKTTWMRGFAQGCRVTDAVCSPTFALLHHYSGPLSLYHFDLYRLPSKEEFFKAGFDEYFYRGGVCCIEWAEKLEDLLPPHAHRITLSHVEEGIRHITIDRP